MAPDQRGEVGDVIVVGIHAVQPDLANSLLHVDGVPVHDRIESKTEGAKLLFLPLLKRTPDFAAFAMMDTPAEAVTQFCVVELGQDAPPKGRVVDIMKNVDGLGDPADFGERAGQGSRLVPDLERPHDARRLEMPEFQRAGEADDIRPVFADQREIDGAFAEVVERAVIGFPVLRVRSTWARLVCMRSASRACPASADQVLLGPSAAPSGRLRCQTPRSPRPLARALR